MQELRNIDCEWVDVWHSCQARRAHLPNKSWPLQVTEKTRKFCSIYLQSCGVPGCQHPIFQSYATSCHSHPHLCETRPAQSKIEPSCCLTHHFSHVLTTLPVAPNPTLPIFKAPCLTLVINNCEYRPWTNEWLPNGIKWLNDQPQTDHYIEELVM